jgi:hypothetical protein
MTSILTIAVLLLLVGLGAAAAIYVRQEHERARRLYEAQLREALDDGVLTPEEARELATLRAEQGLSDAEARMIARACYRRALRAAVADAEVDEEEAARLDRLREQLGFTADEIQVDERQYQRLRLLSRIERGDLPEVPAPFLLLAGERCHWVAQATLCRRIGIPAGSRPMPEGVGYRVLGTEPFRAGGARDALGADARILPLDLGLLVVTSHRTIFRGAKQRVSFPHGALERVVLYRDGLSLEAEEPRYILVDDAELTGAVVLGAARKRRAELRERAAARGRGTA